MHQKETKIVQEAVLEFIGPPSSPPMNTLLAIKKIIQRIARMQKTKTLNPRAPPGTKYPSKSFLLPYF